LICRQKLSLFWPVAFNKALGLAGTNDEDIDNFETLPTIGTGATASDAMTGAITDARPGSFAGSRGEQGQSGQSRSGHSQSGHDNLSGSHSGQTTQIPGISGKNISYLPGDIIDNAYQLTKLIGRGGMGAVFSCRHLALNQEYALKLLSGQELTSDAWSRFQAEAKALARLNHPGIIAVYNMGVDKSQCPYYVMDLLHGEALNTTIAREGQLPYERTIDIFIQVADALSSAHGQGIIHRDIKPSNLMLVPDQKTGAIKVKLVDFGIARLTNKGSDTQSQTATGLVFGTPYYMSPEQCDGQRVDERSDIYSLGCAMFETLTGNPPFVGGSTVETLLLHGTKPAPTLKSRSSKQEFPQALETAVQKMLSKKPADRYQAMSQLKHDLERIKSGKEILSQGLTAPQSSLKILAEPVKRAEVGPETGTTISTTKKVALIAAIVTVIAAAAAISIHLSGSAARKQALRPAAPTTTKAKRDLVPQISPYSESLEYLTGDELKSGGPSYFATPIPELRKLGASEAEIKRIDTRAISPLQHDCDIAKRRFEKHLEDTNWAKAMFKVGGVYHFPDDVSLGKIQFGTGPLIDASGPVPAPANVRACLYLVTSTKSYLNLLDKFGPDDLTGLALVFDASDLTINKLATWNKLDDLWFFNPILKTLPAHEEWEESDFSDQYLYKLELLKHLKSLGLARPVSGEAIVKMPILRRLECLRISRIYRPENLYNNLAHFDNIKELYISSQNTQDAELEYFVEMKNLQRLTIKRSALTFKSSEYFKRMPALKYLCLDRNDWTAKQKAQLKTMMPRCQIVFDTVIDNNNWNTLPKAR